MSIREKLADREQNEPLKPIAIGLRPRMISRLDQLAEQHDLSRSEVVRLLVDEGLSELEEQQQ